MSAAEPAPPMSGAGAALFAAGSLALRELRRFFRQRTRIIGALGQPVLFWILFGAGLAGSFRMPGAAASAGYASYFLPGVAVMILLFTAIFSTISIIEDRREGFLQSVLVAPVSRMSIVLGKVLGGTILAFGQGLLFLLLAPTIGVRLTVTGFFLSLVIMLVVAFALTALGFCIAWRMSSTQGFHAIMNLFLMPMWFLSGALFPASGAMGGLGWVMRLNPLTYGLAALRRAMYWHDLPASTTMPPLWLSLGVTVGFAIVMIALASAIARKTTAGDLQ